MGLNFATLFCSCLSSGCIGNHALIIAGSLCGTRAPGEHCPKLRFKKKNKRIILVYLFPTQTVLILISFSSKHQRSPSMQSSRLRAVVSSQPVRFFYILQKVCRSFVLHTESLLFRASRAAKEQQLCSVLLADSATSPVPVPINQPQEMMNNILVVSNLPFRPYDLKKKKSAAFSL